MDYTMEDTQNAAPNALETSKLNSSSQRNDTQGVTKRYVILAETWCTRMSINETNVCLPLACNPNSCSS